MAKKKAVTTTEETENKKPEGKSLKDLMASIVSTKRILEEKKIIVSVSPSFDLNTGGVPEGTFMALTGREKIGKTLLALSIAAQAQKIIYANPALCPKGRRVYYFNIEHRIKERDLLGIQGLDLSEERFLMVESKPGNILSSQDHCRLIEHCIHNDPGCIAIVDSFSMLSSAEELAADIGYQDRGKSNTIVAQLMRKIAGPLAVNKCIVIGITHGMANTSGYGASFVEKSANALKYAEDIKLSGKSVEPWRIGTDKTTPQIGQKVDWNVNFSSILPPGGLITNHIRYGIGIDRNSELAEIGADFGLIEKGGAWYTLTYLNEDIPKLNGMEQVIKALNDKPEWADELRKKVYDIGGIAL